MNEQHPLVDRYLSRLREGLTSMAPDEREDVVREIRSHLAEAIAAGKPIDAVIESLGSADALARAYSMELLLHPRESKPRSSRAGRWLAIIGLLAVGSIPSFVVVVVLFAIGVSFFASGIAVFAAGLLGLADALPPFVQMNADPRLAIIAGPPLVIGGIVALIALVGYVRFAVRTVRRVLPST